MIFLLLGRFTILDVTIAPVVLGFYRRHRALSAVFLHLLSNSSSTTQIMLLLESVYDHFLQHLLPYLGVAGLLVVGMLALSRWALGSTMRGASTRQQSIGKGPSREPGGTITGPSPTIKASLSDKE